jgi:hypothetical protein
MLSQHVSIHLKTILGHDGCADIDPFSHLITWVRREKGWMDVFSANRLLNYME